MPENKQPPSQTDNKTPNNEGERGRDGGNVKPQPDTGKTRPGESDQDANRRRAGEEAQRQRDEAQERPGTTGGRK